MKNEKLPAFIRRDVERAIEDALHPKGMSTHDGKARIGVDRLQYMMRVIDGPRENADVLEFLRSFIAGGVNQDFKLWANELYKKLYGSSAEPRERHRGDEIEPKRAQQAWYHVGQLAITEPDLPVQQAVQRVYLLCSRENRTAEPT